MTLWFQRLLHGDAWDLVRGTWFGQESLVRSLLFPNLLHHALSFIFVSIQRDAIEARNVQAFCWLDVLSVIFQWWKADRELASTSQRQALDYRVSLTTYTFHTHARTREYSFLHVCKLMPCRSYDLAWVRSVGAVTPLHLRSWPCLTVVISCRLPSHGPNLLVSYINITNLDNHVWAVRSPSVANLVVNTDPIE